MIATLKLPLHFDVTHARKELDEFVASEWSPHFNTQYYEGDWSGIALRAAADAHMELYPDPTAESFVPTAALERCPSVGKILDAFECEMESVRFLRLGPGAVIREHRDYKLGFEDGIARVHIPIKTNPAVDFFLAGERIEMLEGEAWYLNFNLPHSVVNRSQEERVHFVIDCLVNDWMRKFFAA